MIGAVVALVLSLFYLGSMVSLLRRGRDRRNESDSAKPANLPGFETAEEVIHARLAHFPAQIGHWDVPGMNHNPQR